MFRRKNDKTRIETAPLPTEIWLIIFGIVVEEGIIRLDYYDHTTSPHMESFSALARRYHFYDSYRRLRLVCRRFNALLRAQPWQSFLASSLLPFPITTRALYIDLTMLFRSDFQRLLAETSTCGRLVYLDVTCHLHVSESSGLPNLSDFLRAGRAFGNVQRLTLRIAYKDYFPAQVSFWTRLHRAFPSLVTLAVVTEFWYSPMVLSLEGDDEVVHLERLEILYFNCPVAYSGCHFPRLRQASIRHCSQHELEILTLSPHLESLFIQLFAGHQIDVSSCLRLKSLGVPEAACSKVATVERDHPLEHLWLFLCYQAVDYRSSEELVKRLPGISRVTIDLSTISRNSRTWVTHDFRTLGFGSVGMSPRPLVDGDSLLVIERSPGLLGDLMKP